MGIDEIPAEVLKNESAMNILYRLFSICFRTGIIPDNWNYSIITPIPKSSTRNIRDLQNYRGISLALERYKIYCCILNMRLETWVTKTTFYTMNKMDLENRGALQIIYPQ